MTIVLVSYDIGDDKRRLAVMDKLKAMGFIRVQRSLYVAKGGWTLAKDAARALTRIVNASEDSVLILVVDGLTFNRAIRLGNIGALLNEGVVVV